MQESPETRLIDKNVTKFPNIIREMTERNQTLSDKIMKCMEIRLLSFLLDRELHFESKRKQTIIDQISQRKSSMDSMTRNSLNFGVKQ